MISLKSAVFVSNLLTFSAGEIILNGNLSIGGLFQIQNEASGGCSGVVPLSVKNLEAVKWTIQGLNEQDYIPGVTIGFEAWETCGSEEIAVDKTIDILHRIREEKTDTTTTPLAGLIGPPYSNSAQRVSLMMSSQREEDRLFQVGFSTTASSLSDSSVYNNFFRVVPSDAIQTEVIISLMKQLEWNYIAILYDDTVYGREGRDALVKLAQGHFICIAANVSLTPGALNLGELITILESFITHTESAISGVVVFTSDLHVKTVVSAATSLRADAIDPLSFIFSEAIGLSDSYFKQGDNNIFSAAKGAFVVSPPNINVIEFENYWKSTFENVSHVVEESRTNPWLKEVFQFYSNCLPSTDQDSPGCPNLSNAQLLLATKHSMWTSYAIQAAYIVAKVIKDSHSRLCSGEAGMCNKLRNALHTNKGSLFSSILSGGMSVNFNTDLPNVPQSLQNISITFSTGSDIKLSGFSHYEVYNYRQCLSDGSSFCFEKLGALENGHLTIDKTIIRDYHTNTNGDVWPNVNFAQCKEGKHCKSCTSSESADQIYFKNGDLIVGGVVPVYEAGIDSPLSCGKIRKSLGNEIVQAMEYVIELVNKKTGAFSDIFPGKKVGLLIINSCDQPLLLKNKVLNLLQNGYTLPNGEVVYLMDRLVGFVGPYSSSMSVSLAEILEDFGFIQIAYAATAIRLSDRSIYPLFTRVSTPDDKQVKAMINIIRHQKYNSNYIQLVYSKGTYGESGRDSIKSEAVKAGICVEQELMVDDDSNFNTIYHTLRAKPLAKIVILFVRSHQVEPITTILNQNMQYGEFMFIGSEAWGFRPDEFRDKDKLVGSMVITLQLPQNDNFTRHLETIGPTSKTDNPWLADYIADRFNCHLPLSFNKTHKIPCDPQISLAPQGTFTQGIWTPFALIAMQALLQGTSSAFIELCGSKRATLCDSYLRNPTTVRNSIISQNVDLDDSGSSVPAFDKNGDGNVGYTIYNLQKSKEDTSKVEYTKVGSFSVDGASFELDQDIIQIPDNINLPSLCPNDVTCSSCLGTSGTKNNVSAVSVTKTEDSSMVPVLGGLLGVVAVAFVIILIILVLKCKSERGSSPEDEYLNVVYARGGPQYLTADGVQNPQYNNADELDKDSHWSQERNIKTTGQDFSSGSDVDTSAPPSSHSSGRNHNFSDISRIS